MGLLQGRLMALQSLKQNLADFALGCALAERFIFVDHARHERYA